MIKFVVSHCVEIFRPYFDSLHWHATCSERFSMPLDRVVIDLS